MTVPGRPELRIAGPGKPITGMRSWLVAAPPKSPGLHWKKDHSAMELARAWVGDERPAQPDDMTAALAGHPDTAGFRAWDAIPELITRLDDAPRGEHRNHDLVAVGAVGEVATLVAVEAKAREAFGPTVGARAKAAEGKTGSYMPERMSALIHALTGKRPTSTGADAMPGRYRDLRYQLLTGSVGAVIEAERRHCERAVFLVHEFVPAKSAPRGIEAELDHLLEILVPLDRARHDGAATEPGTVRGPFRTFRTKFVSGEVPLYVAWARTELP